MASLVATSAGAQAEPLLLTESPYYIPGVTSTAHTFPASVHTEDGGGTRTDPAGAVRLLGAAASGATLTWAEADTACRALEGGRGLAFATSAARKAAVDALLAGASTDAEAAWVAGVRECAGATCAADAKAGWGWSIGGDAAGNTIAPWPTPGVAPISHVISVLTEQVSRPCRHAGGAAVTYPPPQRRETRRSRGHGVQARLSFGPQGSQHYPRTQSVIARHALQHSSATPTAQPTSQCGQRSLAPSGSCAGCDPLLRNDQVSAPA